jgi:hypothetical protein
MAVYSWDFPQRVNISPTNPREINFNSTVVAPFLTVQKAAHDMQPELQEK